MNQRGKNALLTVVACLLFLVAGRQFWSMAVDMRNREALSSHSTHIQQKIVSHVDPQRPDPFRDLNLTEDQRRQIDDMMQANLPKLPPPGQGKPGQPRMIRIQFPLDKIRAVLTEEQRKKFDRMHQGMAKGGPIFHIGGPGGPGPGMPDGSGPGGPDGPGPNASSPQMFMMRRGP